MTAALPETDVVDDGRIRSLPLVKSDQALSDCGEITVATTDSDSSSSDTTTVSFGPIFVREYERIVGDHPETQIGVPLGLGWGFYQREAISIEKFESDRIPKRNLRMSSITRKNILHNVWGIPEDELRAAEKEVQQIKRSRPNKPIKLEQIKQSKSKKLGRKIRKLVNVEALMKGLTVAISSGAVIPTPHHIS